VIIRDSKSQTRKSKIETGKSKIDNLERFTSFEFRVSIFGFLLLLTLATSACNWFHPQPLSESDRRELAARFKIVVTSAGGAQIWIKHSLSQHQRQGPEVSLQVLATPAAYQALLSAVQQESNKDNLDLGTSASYTRDGLHTVNLHVMRHGQHIIQIHLREVPRLLRAAIVIDDMGNDREAAHKLVALDYPLTFSVLPFLRYTRITAEEVHRSGHEVMLHLPMEPYPNAHASPGEGAVLVGMNAAEVRRIVQNDLASVPYVAGVNNHMGSRATQDAALMASVMKALADRQLYFIDSRTTAATTALEVARRQHLPAFYRAVFLDDMETVSYTLGQLREFRRRVEQEGVALAIGHPHATTIAALEKFLPEFERADIELVAPSQIVRLPEITRLYPPASSN
jgi:polysaccharide deacetylase 2 family uncharacterized protein YibQ